MHISKLIAAAGLGVLLTLVLLVASGRSQQYRYPSAQSPAQPAAQGTAGTQVTPYPAYGTSQPGQYAQPAPRPAAGQPVQPASPYQAQPPASAPRLGPLTEQEIDAMIVARPGEHPLMPALRWARKQRAAIAAISDYTAILVKQERVDGELLEQQYIYCKIRHKPFSVYLGFLAPEDDKGQEVIYIEGRNNGEMFAHGTGMKKTLGTLSLTPTGMLAMRGQRYPITEIGLLNLVTRLGQVAENDTQYGECNVQFYKNATLGNRPCVCMQVVHPVPRREFRFHLARIYVDRQLNLPIRYESYGWPEKPNEPPPLLEQYTYTNLKLNAGLTDADFDTRNPNYQFP